MKSVGFSTKARPQFDLFVNICFAVIQRRYEDDLDDKKKENNKLNNKMKAMSEELMKGNDIIKKLQGEIKNYHGKVWQLLVSFGCNGTLFITQAFYSPDISLVIYHYINILKFMWRKNLFKNYRFSRQTVCRIIQKRSTCTILYSLF